MNQLDKKDNADLDKIDRDINFHRIMVFLILITAIFFYMIFINLKVTESAQSWGPVGDFFGGILNPIFGLFAFYWLTYSVRLQIKELKETRVELAKATKAQEESAKHQEEIARLESENVKTQVEILELNKDTLKSQQDAAIAQQQQIALQNFESLFFQLLKAKTDITNDIRYFRTAKGHQEAELFVGKEAIKYGIEGFKQSQTSMAWEEYYRHNLLDYMGSYFRICYQITKLIDNTDDLNGHTDTEHYSKKRKEYFDIFRATLTQYELEVFFFNCLGKYGKDNFKSLVEKYGIFEHILFENNVYDHKAINKISRFAYKYNGIAFEDSDAYKSYFDELSRIKFGLSEKDFNSICIKLKDVKFILNLNSIRVAASINSLISWKMNELIFTENNIEIIKEKSISYYKKINEIKDYEGYIKEYKSMIEYVENYFKVEGREPVYYEKVRCNSASIYSLSDLDSSIDVCKEHIEQKNNYLGMIDSFLEELRKNEYTETVLTVIKYNIDYLEYCKYMNNNEEKQQKKSA